MHTLLIVSDHKPVSRAASLPPNHSPNIAGLKRVVQRSKTFGHSIRIIITSPEEEQQLSVLQECLDAHLTVDDHTKHPDEENMTRSQSGSFSISTCSGDDQDIEISDFEIVSEESHQAGSRRYASVSEQRNVQSSEGENETKRHHSWSPGVLNITLNLGSPPSKAAVFKQETTDKEDGVFDSGIMKKPVQATSDHCLSGESHMCFPVTPSLTTSSENTAEDNNKSHGIIIIFMSCKHAFLTFFAYQYYHYNHYYYAAFLTGVQRNKDGYSLKKLGQKLPWKVKKIKEAGREKGGQYMWCIERESLLHSIWDHRTHDLIKCSEHISIDIGCADGNPYLTLTLYPYGIFSDANKSMTLQFKVVMPDNCPPLHISSSFELYWEMCISDVNNSDKSKWLKEMRTVTFKTGMDYVHKFLPHSILQQHTGKMLEISVYTNTTVSLGNNITYGDHSTSKNMGKNSAGIAI